MVTAKLLHVTALHHCAVNLRGYFSTCRELFSLAE